MSKVIVISAHPDDMEIGMGGTVAMLTERGDEVCSIVVTDGRRSPNPFGWTQDVMAAERKKEAAIASKHLGIEELVYFELKDISLDREYELAKMRLIEVFRTYNPDEIYTLHPIWDRHPTHRLVGKLTVESLNAQPSLSRVRVWAYEVWGLFQDWDRVEYIDRQIAVKLRAISEHKSQVAQIPYGEGVLGLNRWRAIFCDPHEEVPMGVYAEVFKSIHMSCRLD